MIGLFLVILGGVIAFHIVYKRYFPVHDTPSIDIGHLEMETINVLDLRDYNASSIHSFNQSSNIPIAYLKRYYNEIPKNNVYIVASSKLEKNIGIRFLRAKGFHIVGYMIVDKCKSDQPQICINH